MYMYMYNIADTVQNDKYMHMYMYMYIFYTKYVLYIVHVHAYQSIHFCN